MAYTKGWFFTLNTALTISTILLRNKDVLWFLKQALVAGGWVVVSSVGSGVYGASDKWLLASNITWGAGNTRSYIVLKSPPGLVAGPDGSYLGDQSCLWLSIECVNATASLSFVLHKTAPTGGTVTTLPTSTGSIASGSVICFFPSTVTGSKLHIGVSSGENVGGTMKGVGSFYVVLTSVQAKVETIMLMLPVTDYKALPGGLDIPYGVGFKCTTYSSPGASVDTTSVAHSPLLELLSWNDDGTQGNLNCFFSKTANNLVLGTGETIAGNILTTTTLSNLLVVRTSGTKGDVIGKVADIRVTGAILTDRMVDSPVTTCVLNGSTTSMCLLLPSNAAIVT